MESTGFIVVRSGKYGDVIVGSFLLRQDARFHPSRELIT